MIADNEFLDAALFIAVLIPSVILHEVAHGWAAHRLGDDTARRAGRLTLNPVPHIDPFGSVLLPGMLALAGQSVFGWAKPVPVNPARFERPREGMALTALAGPATNLFLAAVIARLGPFEQVGDRIQITSDALWARGATAFLLVNVALAIFNMLPIPPLDGSRLLPLVLPPGGRRLYDKLAPYGILLLIALIFVFRDSLSFLVSWMSTVIRVLV